MDCQRTDLVVVGTNKPVWNVIGTVSRPGTNILKVRIKFAKAGSVMMRVRMSALRCESHLSAPGEKGINTVAGAARGGERGQLTKMEVDLSE